MKKVKRFVATWLLSWADLIDTLTEVLTLGLVLHTKAAHAVSLAAEEALYQAGWIYSEDTRWISSTISPAPR